MLDICRQWAHVLTKPIVWLPRSELTRTKSPWCSLGSPTSNKHFMNSFRDYQNVCTVQINWDQYLQGFCNVSNIQQKVWHTVCVSKYLSLYHISNSWAALTSAAKKVKIVKVWCWMGERGEMAALWSREEGGGGWLNNFAPEFATLVKSDGWRGQAKWRGCDGGWYQNPGTGSVNFQGQFSSQHPPAESCKIE